MPIVGRPLPPRWESERFVVLDEAGAVVGFARKAYGLEVLSNEVTLVGDRELRNWFESWTVPPGQRTFNVRDNVADRCYTIHGAFHEKSSLPGVLTVQRIEVVQGHEWWPPEGD